MVVRGLCTVSVLICLGSCRVRDLPDLLCLPCDQEQFGPIVVDDGSDFGVPDQSSGTPQHRVCVRRLFDSDFERSLILAAERTPSTVGSTWWNASFPTRRPCPSSSWGFGCELLVPAAVGIDALKFAVERVSHFLTERPELLITSAVGYEAVVEGPIERFDIGGETYADVFVVSLRLSYEEFGRISTSGVLYSGPDLETDCPAAKRGILFDRSGSVLRVIGDGAASMLIVN